MDVSSQNSVQSREKNVTFHTKAFFEQQIATVVLGILQLLLLENKTSQTFTLCTDIKLMKVSFLIISPSKSNRRDNTTVWRDLRGKNRRKTIVIIQAVFTAQQKTGS